jgi:hypothetical protein
MKYVRLYADKNGDSHFEEVEVAMSPVNFAPPAPPLDVSCLMPSTNVGFLGAPAGWDGSPHPAPRRLLFIFLTGGTEITASDGEVRRFGPGNVVLVEDTSGKGHASRVLGYDYGIAVIVQLAD